MTSALKHDELSRAHAAQAGPEQAKAARYLDCLAGITSQLLAAPDPWSLIPDIVSCVQEVTAASRCYLFECRRTEDGLWHTGQRFQALGQTSAEPEGGLALVGRDEHIADCQRWIELLSTGHEIVGRVTDLPEPEQLLLKAFQAQWLAVMPLIVDGRWVGCLGLEASQEQERDGALEVALLRAVANTVSATLGRVVADTTTRQVNALLAGILRSSKDFVLIATDLKFRVLLYNNVAEAVFGYTEAEATGRSLDELDILESATGDISEDIVAAVFEEDGYNTTVDVRDPRGDYHTLEINVTGMQDEHGTLTGYLLIAHDITEKLRVERRSMRSERMESVGLLAGGIAHDFNNILMGILGYASLIKDSLGPEHEAARMVEIIEQSGERAAALTGELLAYARGGKYQSVILRLDKQTQELLNIIRTNLPKGVDVRFDLAPDLPHVLADPVQMQQVIMNICLNAGDAIREKQQQLGDPGFCGRIKISTQHYGLDLSQLVHYEVEDEVLPGQFVVLGIEDDGIGMTEQTRRQIFEPFFTTKFAGRGLGLAAVDGIVRNHGGFISVESTPGVGTRFLIHLPAYLAAVDDEDETPTLPKAQGTETVLLIDDEEVVRQLALLTLANLGYEVLLAKDGREALNVLDEHRGEINLVISDLLMPGLSGNELITRLRDAAAGIPLMVISGYDKQTAQSITKEMAEGFLRKPYTPEALSRAVRTVLDEAAAKDE
ncbi:response regulator [bacterium]|nr:response regulator [bacterium]